jgi:predicted amidohydrolase
LDSLTLACIQQRMHLPISQDEYRENLRRFMRIAANKGARLVVFPELGGLMVTPPLLGDYRSGLLKRADIARRREASLWQRLVGQAAGGLAAYLKADLRRSLAALLDVSAADVWGAYVDLYGGLAREFGVTVVAPSGYLPDPLDGVVRNLAAVFGADGALLGIQAKVVLHPADAGIAQPGSAWDVIPTDVGRIGVILGGDVLGLPGRGCAGDACRLYGPGDVQQGARRHVGAHAGQSAIRGMQLLGGSQRLCPRRPAFVRRQVGHFRSAGINPAAQRRTGRDGGPPQRGRGGG